MAEFKETVGENTQRRALMDALGRIRERGQSQFTNPLKFLFSTDPDSGRAPRDPIIYIVEVEQTKRYWLGIIPRTRTRYRTLVSVDSGFWGGAYGKKEFNCAVFDRSLLEIVKEEVQKYAVVFQVTAVNLTQDFVR